MSYDGFDTILNASDVFGESSFNFAANMSDPEEILETILYAFDQYRKAPFQIINEMGLWPAIIIAAIVVVGSNLFVGMAKVSIAAGKPFEPKHR